ncbi:NPC intracellular cholesterol transporter 2 homolog a [Thrips palmi]|uniref:NPC intracellular cholesterol transporter 2 homolog a n=1 Tax=Thrips palmi TaxID=161013 RepID=A0A6P8YQP0_THRPL|nr:NPC intracellular cholesterol transporter 2 homolog a [Thrips palmi]
MNALAVFALAALAAVLAVQVAAAAEQAKPAPVEVEICGVEAAKRKAKAAAGDDADIKDKENIAISNCVKAPCRLRRKTTTHVEFKFTPDTEVKTLKTEVNAKILGIPFPFIGVDNTNACGGIFLADGTKASCPLKAGQEYLYRNKFDILEIYPKVKVLVHWALVNQNGERILCFNVPAKITS